MSPRTWRSQPLDDRAAMMAYDMYSDTREAYRQEWQEDRRQGRRKPGDKNEYQRMKDIMGI